MDPKLQQLFNQSWQELLTGSQQPHHAFHTLTVANIAVGGINTYTVVLRDAKVDEHQLIFYTDVRSEKVQELNANNHISALVYDREQQCQLVIKGVAAINHQDELSLHHWKKSGYKGRTSYLAQQPPSTPVDTPTDGLNYLLGKEFADDDMEGYENFAVITIGADSFEYLKLSRQEGNRRARFQLNDNTWQGNWIVP